MVQDILLICFKLLGALALFMYGMQLSSDGIQKAAGDRLQKTVNFMTRNRFMGVFTGILITVLIQSSSATTVMAVSFVNAGLLSLVQSIGVIMGANIGTTLTGWIIAAVGVQKFSIALIAVPIFGVGFFMTLLKKRGNSFAGYGEALMGFGMIFLGLEYLSKAIPTPSGDFLLFLHDFADTGYLAILVCVLVGTLFTMLVHASSATIAIVIGLVSKMGPDGSPIISFEMAAAFTLGANVGTTIDSFLVSLGTNTNAKRAAWAHIMFNIVGTVWVAAAIRPFIMLVDFVTPGAITPLTAGAHIAMMHTLFNTANTLVLLPFTGQYAALLERLIKPKAGEAEMRNLVYAPGPLLSSPELNIMKARADIGELAKVSESMLSRFRSDLPAQEAWGEEKDGYYAKYGEYAITLKDGISRFLIEIARQDIGEKAKDNIGVMLRMVADFENMSHSVCNMATIQSRATRKKQFMGESENAQLEPYTSLVLDFMRFVTTRMDKPLSAEDLALAIDYEARVDDCRADLKKLARKRIKKGADVKTELNFMDLTRHLEKIGDYAYSVAVALREMK